VSLNQNEHLNALVQELSKKSPNVELIKTKTTVLGIPYSNDLIILMSEVLVYLSKTPPGPFLKEKET
jgi:hypothetical protein